MPTRVLLCDDTKEILLLLTTELGFDPDIEVVAQAENGEQAIELASEHKPDVVVLDVAMPVMDGLEALPKIKEAAPAAKVIMLSGFGGGAMASEALALGAEHYMEKGSSASDIAEAVKDVDRPDG